MLHTHEIYYVCVCMLCIRQQEVRETLSPLCVVDLTTGKTARCLFIRNTHTHTQRHGVNKRQSYFLQIKPGMYVHSLIFSSLTQALNALITHTRTPHSFVGS
mmetsp:Transcript_30845/g.89729  ORF Transcript_30845/g.89729 Transcript_30845/m.89729 type:complete len:102 (+) Transcript_30845:534-839(+)